MVSEHVYKPPFSHQQALRMILDGECGVFHPILLECLKEAGPRLELELRVRSDSNMAQAQSQQMAARFIANGKASTAPLHY